MSLPFENDTKKIERKLVKRSLKSERRRNVLVIIAVMLASFMICFAGTMALSMRQKSRAEVTDTYEAVYSGLAEEKQEEIKEDPRVGRAGDYYLIGPELPGDGYTAFFIFADEDMLYIGRGQIVLKEGRAPEKTGEIAVSDTWLEAYAPGCGVGSQVSVKGGDFQGTFTVSGILEGVRVENLESYSFLISREDVKAYRGYDPSGWRSYVHLKGDRQMDKEQMEETLEQLRTDLRLDSMTVNSGYFRTFYGDGEDTGSTVAALLVLAVVVFAGACIVIQSIFRISVLEKIRSYGQLRTLGATKRQLGRIVSGEGRILGLTGIAAGILAGLLIPVLAVPGGFTLPGYLGMSALTLLICYGMVRLSIRRPVKIAASVSPVEAARTGLPGERRRERERALKERPAVPRLTPRRLGMINFRRDRRKVVSILASISIGGVLLLAASSLLLTYSPERMARMDYPEGDFKLYIESDRNLTDIFREGNPLSEELREEVQAIDGVESVTASRQSAGISLKAEDDTVTGIADMLTEENRKEVEEALRTGSMPDMAEGSSEEGSSVEGSGCILVSEAYTDEDGAAIREGEKLRISLGGEWKEVTVSGVFQGGPGAGHGGLQLDSAGFYLTEEMFRELFPESDSFDYSWQIRARRGSEEQVEQALENVARSHQEIALETFEERVAWGEASYSFVFHILQGLATLIALLGVVNLINTTLSNQISRQREISAMRCVGLTNRQLGRMVAWEGVSYAALSILVTVAAGLPLSLLLHRYASLLQYSRVVPYEFPFLYMGIYGAVLLGLECILSVWIVKRQKKQPLIEQLRTVE